MAILDWLCAEIGALVDPFIAWIMALLQAICDWITSNPPA